MITKNIRNIPRFSFGKTDVEVNPISQPRPTTNIKTEHINPDSVVHNLKALQPIIKTQVKGGKLGRTPNRNNVRIVF
jgi:hypothetical protein